MTGRPMQRMVHLVNGSSSQTMLNILQRLSCVPSLKFIAPRCLCSSSTLRARDSGSESLPPSAPGTSKQHQHQHESRAMGSSPHVTQISVNRSGLLPTQMHYRKDSAHASRQGLAREITQMIELSGPITLAEYMLYALQHPTLGYYMRKEGKIGQVGDFVTAPEISQVFGELMAVWCVVTWTAMGSPSKLQVVELGPGKGTLMSDVLRAASSFPDFRKALTVHLVETSDDLRMLQMEALGLTPTDPQGSESTLGAHGDGAGLRARASRPLPGGGEIFWHSKLDQVPKGPSLFIAQEFLDALPVHQFQYTAEGWREVLVDLKIPDTGGVSDVGMRSEGDADGSGPMGDEQKMKESADMFRLILSGGETTAVQAFLRSRDELPVYLGGKRRSKGMKSGNRGAAAAATGSRGEKVGDKLEVSPESIVLVKEVAARIAEHRGGALFVDYGEDHALEDSLRSYKGHKEVSVLTDPGNADITADVNFALLRRVIDGVKGARSHGPVGQGQFLGEMGIGERLRALADQDDVSEEQVESMLEGYVRLVDPAQMGMRYKVLAITDARQETPPPGFLSAGSSSDPNRTR